MRKWASAVGLLREQLFGGLLCFLGHCFLLLLLADSILHAFAFVAAVEGCLGICVCCKESAQSVVARPKPFFTFFTKHLDDESLVMAFHCFLLLSIVGVGLEHMPSVNLHSTAAQNT